VALNFESVEARGLVKVFGGPRALAGVDLLLKAGQVTSVEGPNGSGKSTLLALLSLTMRPSRGSIYFGEHDARKRPALRASVGVLAHSAMVYPDLTGRENLELTARLYGLDPAEARVKALPERFELGAWLERPCRTYSRGQLQRVALARAVLHQPTLLLLDEPSTGLDSSAVDRLVEAIDAERKRGAIVLLVTHDSALSERLADRRLVLERGRLQEAS